MFENWEKKVGLKVIVFGFCILLVGCGSCLVEFVFYFEGLVEGEIVLIFMVMFCVVEDDFVILFVGECSVFLLFIDIDVWVLKD